MATIYVDSAATGTNLGTSWTNAYTSIASTTSAAAGDTILVDDGHAQSFGAQTNLGWTNGTDANPVKVLCVDRATNALSSGASVATSSGELRVHGNAYVHGVNFTSVSALRVAWVSASRLVLASCTLTATSITVGGSTGACRSWWRDVTVNFSGAGTDAKIDSANSTTQLTWRGGTYTARAAQVSLFWANSGWSRLTLEGVVVGACTNVVEVGSGQPVTAVLRRCRLGAYTNLMSAQQVRGNRVELEGCTSGSVSAPPLGLTKVQDFAGTVQSDLTRYRTGGADDGSQANAHSWEMATNANALEVFHPLESPPLVRWVAGGAAVTVTVYVASGATLNNDGFWIEVLGPDDSSPAFTEGYGVTTRMAPQGTPAALTTDGASTWNGSGVGTKQKVSVTYTPTLAGPVFVRAFLAKPSTTAYVDPLVEVT